MAKVLIISGFSLVILGIILIMTYFINKIRTNVVVSRHPEGSWILWREDSEGPIPSMYVYSYIVNGMEYQLKSTAVNKQVNNVGDNCTIWYNPVKPQEAQEFHYESNRIYNFVLISGILMSLSGVIIFGIGMSV